MATEDGAEVRRVIEKTSVTAEEGWSSKARFREELRTVRRKRFFAAYVMKQKQKMKINTYRESLQRAAS